MGIWLVFGLCFMGIWEVFSEYLKVFSGYLNGFENNWKIL